MTLPAAGPLQASARRSELLARLIAALTDGAPPDIPPLKLHDRGLGDPTVALLDAWSTVGDVIGFYLDRIAEEGYAATAREAGSVLALAGLVGHRPRPGLAATLHVAYTLQTDPADKAVLLPAGLLSQSVPGPGEQPQTFETAAPLLTRPSWNTLPVKTTVPLTLPAGGPAALRQIVVAQITNRISANDAILLSLSDHADPAVARVESVSTDDKARLTTIALQAQAEPPSVGSEAPPSNSIEVIDALTPGLSVRAAAPPRSVTALDRGPDTVFAAGSDAVPRLLAALRPELAADLYGALASTPVGTPAVSAAAVLRVTAVPFGSQAPPRQLFDDRGQPAGTEEPPIENSHALEFKLGIASIVALLGQRTHNLVTLLAQLREALHKLGEPDAPVPLLDVSCESPAGSAQAHVALNDLPFPPASLGTEGALGTVTLALSRTQLKVSYATPGEDRRLPPLEITASLDPSGEGITLALPDGQYTWDPLIRSPIRVPLGDRRLSISWLVNPGTTEPEALSIRIETPLPLANPKRLALDRTYDAIVPGSQVVIDRSTDAPAPSSIAYPVIARVISATQVTRSRSGLTATVTELELDRPWIGEEKLLSAARAITVRAQPDALALQPVTTSDEVRDDQIELDGLIAGMEPGHLILITGTRADLPVAATVAAGEVAMVAGFSQGATIDGDKPHSTLHLAAKLAFRYVRSTVTIYGNVVAARQGASVHEILGSGTPSQQRQSFVLSSAPLLADPDGRSTLSVTVDGVACDEVDRIYGDTPPRAFVTGLDSRGHTTITFAGPLPTGEGNVAASYRAGDGSLGNVRHGQLTQLLSRPLGVTAVTNPLPGTGGTAPDGPGEVRDALPTALRSLGRIVSISDYADFARSWPNIAKTTARPAGDAEQEVVLVTVADRQPIAVSQTVCASIAEAASAAGDADTRVIVQPADLLTIVLVAGVTRDPRYDWDTVAAAVRAMLLTEFGYANRVLGENIVLSRAIAAAHRSPGVLAFSVTALALAPATATASQLAENLPKLLGAGDPVPAVIDLASTRSAWPGAPTRHSPTPDAIAYLDPSVADTLMLTEVPT